LVAGDSGEQGADRLQQHARRLGVDAELCVLPFLPPWGVPNFIRSCDAVALLEHEADIDVHRPITPTEVASTGTCLVLSRELATKQPWRDRIRDGENILIVEPRTTGSLERALLRVVSDPAEARRVGAAGVDLLTATVTPWSEASSRLSSVYRTIYGDVQSRRANEVRSERLAGIERLLAEELPDDDLLRLTEVERSALAAIGEKLATAHVQAIINDLGALFISLSPAIYAAAPAFLADCLERFGSSRPIGAHERPDELLIAFARFVARAAGEGSHGIQYLGDLAHFAQVRLVVSADCNTAPSLEASTAGSAGSERNNADALMQSTLLIAPGFEVERFDFDVLLLERLLTSSSEVRVEPSPTTVVIKPLHGTGEVDVHRLDPLGERTLDLLRARWMTGFELQDALLHEDHEITASAIGATVMHLWTRGLLVAIG